MRASLLNALPYVLGGGALAWIAKKAMEHRPDIDAPTIWGGNVGMVAQIGRALPLLVEAQSQRVQLHTSMEDIRAHGAAHVNRVREAIPGIDVWFGVTGDEHYGDVTNGRMTAAKLLELRIETAVSAAAAGASAIVWNCESAWKHGADGFDAEAAVRMVDGAQSAVPSLRQGFTSYPAPTMHRALPWAGFKRVAFHLPQVYFDGDNWQWMARTFDSSWRDAIRAGMIDPKAVVGAYVRLHGNGTESIGAMVNRFPFASYWWVKDGCDEAGRRAFVALSRIQRQGFLGANRIEAFQRAAGLDVTGRLDRATVRATGVSWD